MVQQTLCKKICRLLNQRAEYRVRVHSFGGRFCVDA